MSMPTKHIDVVTYNPHWPEAFEAERAVIHRALGDNCLAIHHVGSTAVPGLKAKPIIDMIVAAQNPREAITPLEGLGFIYKGELNIPFRFYFGRPAGTAVNLHLYEKRHPEIELNLMFRDYLRTHPETRDAYATLKEALLQSRDSFEKKGSPFTGYTLGKEGFIREVLQKVGFNRLRFVKCTHHSEWDAYHRIRKEQIFDRSGIAYDTNHPTLKAENHFHFILGKGMEIVAVAHVEFLNAHEAALRTLATDAPYKGQGYGKALMALLEKWIKQQGRPMIKLHTDLEAENFYRKLGYQDCCFDDPCIQEVYIDLGKKL